MYDAQWIFPEELDLLLADIFPKKYDLWINYLKYQYVSQQKKF